MSARAIALLLAVALLLGAFVYFYEIRGAPEREASGKRIFADLALADVGEIEIALAGETSVRVLRRGDGFRIVEPVDFPASQAELDGIVQALVELPSEGRIDDPEGLGIYGLDPGADSLGFRVGEGRHGLRFGRSTPLGSNRYVVVDPGTEAEAVHMIADWRSARLLRTKDELRDARVLPESLAGAARIALHLEAPGSPPQDVLLVKGPKGSEPLARDGRPDAWRIEEPRPLEADAEAVLRLLANLGALRAVGFVDDPPPESESGLAAPALALRIGLRDDAGTELRELVVRFGGVRRGDAPPGQEGELLRFADNGERSLYLVPTRQVDALPGDLFALRWKQLGEPFGEPLRTLELAYGADRIALERDPATGSWSHAGRPANQQALDELLEKLSSLRASGIAADAVGPEEQAALGLAPARVELRALGEDGTVLGGLRLGNRDGAGAILAMGDPREMLFRVDPSVEGWLPTSREALQQEIAPPPPEAAPAPAGEPGGAR